MGDGKAGAMTGTGWSTREDAFIRAHAAEMLWSEMTEFLPGRTAVAIKSRSKKLQVRVGTHHMWTAEEVAYVREHAADSVPAVAAALGVPLRSLYQLRGRLGITVKSPRHTSDFEVFIREKHALGWSDSEIAAAYAPRVNRHHMDRHTVGIWRRRMGLPINRFSEHLRRRVAEKTRQQCALAGVKSLAEVRRQAFEKYARKSGWPADLRPRQVQMLNALMARGPMTRRQIADVIGMPWKGSRKSLVGSVPGGSYLADLMRRGMVVQLGRVVKEKGSGHSTNLYSVPLWTERNSDGQQTAQTG